MKLFVYSNVVDLNQVINALTVFIDTAGHIKLLQRLEKLKLVIVI